MIAKNRAEGKCFGPRGVPNGWGRRGAEVAQIRANRLEEAKEIVKTMVEQNIIDEAGLANEALEFAISLVRDPETTVVRDRLAAAKMILEFTKQKPASNANVNLSKAEDFLAALASKTDGQ